MTLREVLGNCGIHRKYNIEYKKYDGDEPVLTGHSKWDGEKLVITKGGLLIVFHKGETP